MPNLCGLSDGSRLLPADQSVCNTLQFECGLRSAGAQHNPAPDDMPVFANTSAFALGNARGGVTWRGVRIVLSVENVFDKLYYDYLSPPASTAPPSGNLVPGARIPGPGRTVTLTVSYGLP